MLTKVINTVLGVIILPFMLFIFLPLMIILFAQWWVRGMPISIKKAGKVVGKLRYFNYTKEC